MSFLGDRYVIESDGLLIKHVTTEDAGTYTCRARVSETGNLEERDITVEVITSLNTLALLYFSGAREFFSIMAAL